MSVRIETLAPPLPDEDSSDGKALVDLERATQERPLALASLLAEADPSVPGVVLVARDGGALIGMASARLLADDVHVIRLAVVAPVRRQGVGRALLTGLVACANGWGARAVLLEVRASNVAAQALYATTGFRTDGMRPRYYTDGEDACVLRLPLQGEG